MAVYLRGTCRKKHRHSAKCSTWHFDFMIKRVRYRKAVPEALTKEQAERAEIQAREQVYQGKYGEPARTKPQTFRQFVEDRYLPIVKETTRYFSTNAKYQAEKLIAHFGRQLIGEITHLEIERWLLEQKQDYSGATINHFIKRLSAIFRAAVAGGYLEPERNPMRLVARIEETPRAKRRLGREEEARILSACSELGYTHTAIATIILIETGLRPRELFEMKREQVVLSEGIIKPMSYKTGRRRAASAQPKERDIPLTPRARAEFEKLLSACGDGRIFPHRWIRKSWLAVCRRASVSGFWFRWLRDEAASRWAEAGLDPFAIAQLLGHSSPQTSMIYVRQWRDETLKKMSASAVATSLSPAAAGRVFEMSHK